MYNADCNPTRKVKLERHFSLKHSKTFLVADASLSTYQCHMPHSLFLWKLLLEISPEQLVFALCGSGKVWGEKSCDFVRLQTLL